MEQFLPSAEVVPYSMVVLYLREDIETDLVLTLRVSM